MIPRTLIWTAGSVLLLSGCASESKNTESSEQAISVHTQQVRMSDASRALSVSGNIEGSKTVRLGFMVAGKVDYIAVQEGQVVAKNQLLSSLDPVNYSIAKEVADIQVNQTQEEYDRLKLMYDRSSISESDFSKIKYGLQQAKAQQKLHHKNYSDTRLYAPIGGVLLKKMVEVGEIVGAGTPLFVLSDIQTVKVNAYIPESELQFVKIGQEAEVLISSLNEVYTGKVIEVGSAAEATSRAFTVKIELPNPKLRIRPGMIAEVKISSGQKRDYLSLPAEAVLRDLDNQNYVYTIDTIEHKAFRKKVTVGALVNNEIQLLSGVRAGELVVVGGQHRLSEGSPVLLK
jgi:RND family efflux transporter MFP subunit